MNGEIKEILEQLDIVVNRPLPMLILAPEYTKILLDYITNLQEENNELKNLEYKFFDCSGDEESFTLNDYLELGNKVYDLQEENERIKKMNMHENKYGSDMEEKYLIEKTKNLIDYNYAYEVENIEENKIPEKLDIYDELQSLLKDNNIDKHNLHKMLKKLELKQNEIIDYLKNKGE